MQRAATSRGVAEIWTATAPAVLTNAAITSTQSVTTVLGAPVNQSLMVFAFTERQRARRDDGGEQRDRPTRRPRS